VEVVVELACTKKQLSVEMQEKLRKAMAGWCGAQVRQVRVGEVAEHLR
jgi:hypothetical protein